VAPLRYLKNELGQDQDKIDAWYHHWILEGFTALETMVAATPYAAGADVTLADICVVPQVANARRLKVPLDRFPKIVAIDAACCKLDAFIKARPDQQARRGLSKSGSAPVGNVRIFFPGPGPPAEAEYFSIGPSPTPTGLAPGHQGR